MINARFYDNPEEFTPSADSNITSLLRDGYCIVDSAVDKNLIDEFLARWEKFKPEAIHPYRDKLVEGDDMVGGRYRRMVNMHLVLPELENLFINNKALQVTDQLFCEPTTLYTSLYFEVGSSQDYHRDTPYFWTNPGYSYFGIWLALEDTDDSNGALTAIRGSHLLQDSLAFREEIGKLDLDESGLPRALSGILWDTYQKRVQDACHASGLTFTQLHIKKGDVIIWHPQLMHGGGKITDTQRTRNSFVMHVTPQHQAVYAQDKYFDPSIQLPSLDKSIKYRTAPNGRLIREEPYWAIAQKIQLSASVKY
jgi:phytanoyl-CoA hydroxylase